MRRTRLIWLAVGIVIGLVAAMIPSFFRSPDPILNLNLVESWGEAEPVSKNEVEEVFRAEVLEKLWACGGRNFVVGLPTHSTEINIPIRPENLKIANCIIEAVRGADISITISNSGK